MAMKGYCTFPKTQHHWNLTIRLFSVISRTLTGGILPLCRGAVGVFYCASRLGKVVLERVQEDGAMYLRKMRNSYWSVNVGWGCRIHRPHLWREVTPLPRVFMMVRFQLWGMRSIPSLSSLRDPLCPGVVVPDRVLCMGQTEPSCVSPLNWISWNWTALTFEQRNYAKLNWEK